MPSMPCVSLSVDDEIKIVAISPVHMRLRASVATLSVLLMLLMVVLFGAAVALSFMCSRYVIYIYVYIWFEICMLLLFQIK